MGEKTEIPKSHKSPLHLASMGNSSSLESTVASLQTRDTDQLSWEAFSADLIQEWAAIKSSRGDSKKRESKKRDEKSTALVENLVIAPSMQIDLHRFRPASFAG